MCSLVFIQGNDKSDREQASKASRSNLQSSFVLSWMFDARAFFIPRTKQRTIVNCPVGEVEKKDAQKWP